MVNIANFDYDWINNNTSHHEYLIKSISKILNSIKTDEFSHLDVGCGNGYLTKKFANKFKVNVGIDLSLEGINQAKKYEDNKLSFRNIDLDKFIVEKKEFDFISCFEVIEHQYLPDTFLKKINTLLKKDGYFILSTPFHGYFKNLAISLLNKHDWHFNPLWRHGHIKFFSIKTLTKLLNETSFKIIKQSFSGRFYPFSSSMIFLCKKN